MEARNREGGHARIAGVSADDDRKSLTERRDELKAELQRSGAKGRERTNRRRSAFRSATRDIAVQGTGTVMGGAVLAGLAQLAGFLPTDPLSVTIIVILAAGLTVSVVSGIRDALQPPITRRDMDISQELDALEVAMQSISLPDQDPSNET